MKRKRGKYLILAAEDNEVNLKMILIILNEAGFRTSSVRNGEEAIRFLSSQKANLVLMDVHMPTMDGFKATKNIRELSGSSNSIPVIAITAHALSGDKEKCFEAGMNDYISKPINPSELIKKVDSWLGITNTEDSVEYNQKEQTVLDYDYLEQISLGNKEFLQDLLLTYIKDVELRLRSLSDALKAGETKNVILESHSIKGASLSIGANIVGKEALAIEISGKSQDLTGAESKYKNLMNAFNEAKKRILEYLGQNVVN